MHQNIHYEYKNLPIPGGGYVTGFLFSHKNPDAFYLRTDIGGTYRFEKNAKRWETLSAHVSMTDLSETFPIAIAVDENKPDSLYIASGVNTEKARDGKDAPGVLSLSSDKGATFSYKTIPTFVHGNLNGRGTGLRLVVDPADSNTLYFASQMGGLLRTKDLGDTWESLDVNKETHMTFVWVSADGNCIVAGTAGVTHKTDHVRGHGLYISTDRGETFSPLSMPENFDIPESKLAGYVPQRWDCDGTYLYITLAMTGRRSYVIENGYSCDSGDTIAGKVLRYKLDEKGYPSSWEDITPVQTDTFLDYGFSGITSCDNKPGLLACSTICNDEADLIFLSLDYGTTWKVVLKDLSIGQMDFRAPYMRPECNGGHNLIHWLSDIKCNPFDENELWFNSGTGVFVTHNLLDETVVFSDWCDGIEETVHLNIYGMPAGEVQVIDIVGDLGGFAFRDVNAPCDNSFADAEGNRYITCINADFSDIHPETVIVTPRGNWKGKTKGGLILSKDQCRSFERLPMPFGISEKLDKLLKGIETPNVNSGWVAMSPDLKHIVWSVADVINLTCDAVICSHDGGKTFEPVKAYDIDGNPLTCITNYNPWTTEIQEGCSLLKVFTDRVNSSVMYGFGENSRIYISTDSGATFYEKELPTGFPVVNFGLIDCANKTEIRVESGKEGVLYLALGKHGLWKMVYDAENDLLSLARLTPIGDEVYRIGLGLLREGGDYITEDKAFYICATLDDEYGFYRSLDQGMSWQKLNTDAQMFGEINSMDGDCRVFGRFYLATGSLGAIYGDEVK